MPNERLREAMRRRGFTYESLAVAVGVDPKSVERWVTHDRVPFARNRVDTAKALDEPEDWLWAVDAVRRERVEGRSELIQLYPRRSMLAGDDWTRLFAKATKVIDVLVYAGLFLPEQLPNAIDELVARAAAGVQVRLLLADPNAAAVAVRSLEEGIDDAVSIKIRNALSLLKRPLADAQNVFVRLHGTTLYTSIYRADDEMIANPHVIGLPAGQAPALHLRRLGPGGLFDTYSAAYDRVWDDAKPAWT